MSRLEHRETERRVKTMLFCSMVGVLVGLMGATLIESDHRQAGTGHPGSLPLDQVNEQKNILNEQLMVENGNHA